MSENNLRKLNRAELLDMLLEVSKENEALREENAYVKHLLNDRRLLIDRAGTIVEAAFEMNHVLQAAQDAADQYLNNVRLLTEQQERELTEQREFLEKEMHDRRAAFEKEIHDRHAALEKELYDKRIVLEQETWDRCRAIEREMISKCQQEREKTRRECEQMRREAEKA